MIVNSKEDELRTHLSNEFSHIFLIVPEKQLKYAAVARFASSSQMIPSELDRIVSMVHVGFRIARCQASGHVN